MKGSAIKTRTANIWLGEDGIIRNVVLPGAEITGVDAKENILSYAQFGGQKYPVLVDIRDIKSFDREGRMYPASAEAGECMSAAALLIGSPLSRAIGNFWLGTRSAVYPVRLFTSEDEAIEWLQQYVEQSA